MFVGLRILQCVQNILNKLCLRNVVTPDSVLRYQKFVLQEIGLFDML